MNWVIEQTFRHTDTDGTVRLFCIPTLKASITAEPDKWELLVGPVNADIAMDFVRRQGVTLADAARYPRTKLQDPAIGCRFDDGSILTVDGNHRLVARWQRGFDHMSWWVCDEPHWTKHLLRPEDVLEIPFQR